MPWYKQTAIWGLLISITALSLSQLPPISTWVEDNSVAVELGSRIGLPNSIGIQGIQVYIDIKNTGNRSINISKLRLEMTRPNESKKEIRAQSYSKLTSGQPTSLEFPITTIGLNPGDSWSELVSFYPDFSPTEEEEINDYRLKISQSIISQQQNRGGQFGKLVEADSAIVSKAKQFFDRKFDLEKGKYRFQLKCDINGEQFILKKATFTLYEYHLTTIKSQKDDYKFGAGIYFPVNQPKQVWALLSDVQ